ncbi:MAG: DUF86 domain-containing protein [Proteobacteria bacterium]|nr:DUF86 domain-containing protein [Pseudomonadota bacterium]
MDDVAVNKAASIERCIKRINEEYRGDASNLRANITRQDSIVLNLQRACEAAIDLAMHLVRKHKLGVPQETREAFEKLESASVLDARLSRSLRSMVGFRNIAVHDYRKLDLEIVQAIIDKHLDDLLEFTRLTLEREA